MATSSHLCFCAALAEQPQLVCLCQERLPLGARVPSLKVRVRVEVEKGGDANVLFINGDILPVWFTCVRDGDVVMVVMSTVGGCTPGVSPEN